MLADQKLWMSVFDPDRSVTRKLPLFVIFRILRSEVSPLFRQVFQSENRCNGAHRHAGAAIDAFSWMDVQLLGLRESRLILSWMDTINGAHVHASGVFSSDARLCN